MKMKYVKRAMFGLDDGVSKTGGNYSKNRNLALAPNSGSIKKMFPGVQTGRNDNRRIGVMLE